MGIKKKGKRKRVGGKKRRGEWEKKIEWVEWRGGEKTSGYVFYCIPLPGSRRVQRRHKTNQIWKIRGQMEAWVIEKKK